MAPPTPNTPLKVQLREIPCHRDIDLDAAFVASAVSGLPIRAVLERPDDDPEAGSARAEVDLYIEDDNVFMRGQLTGNVQVACSRCVGVADLAVEEALTVTFLPASQLAEKDEDEDDDEDGPDDLDVFPYTGEEVDLEPLFREQIVLAIPFAPLCDPECKGLCPSCGTDLNTQSCSCQIKIMDPRWSALEKLK